MMKNSVDDSLLCRLAVNFSVVITSPMMPLSDFFAALARESNIERHCYIAVLPIFIACAYCGEN